MPPPPRPTLFPYTTLFRSRDHALWLRALVWPEHEERAQILQRAIQVTRQNPPTLVVGDGVASLPAIVEAVPKDSVLRSEEHTSELQSLAYLVCRLLLEKKK